MERRVAEIVREALGERPVSVEHVPTLEDSHVFRLHLPSGDAFFKSEHEGHPIAVTAWAYEKAATVGVPVPQVLHLDLTRERWPEEFLVMTAVGGTDLQHDPLEGAALVQTIEAYGELLRRLHGVRLQGFGDLEFPDGSATDPVGPFPDHASDVRARPGWGLPYLRERGLVDVELAGRILEVVDRHGELVAPPECGVFLHDDPGLDHIFVDRERTQITGLIDFEARSGDPVGDLATFGFHYPDLVRHLMDGYGKTPDDLDLRLELYGLLRAIGCARWDHERAFDIGRPLAEIARLTSNLEKLLD